MSKNFNFSDYFINYSRLLNNPEYVQKLESFKKNLIKIKKQKSRVFIFGNGGSAAISSHFATDIRKVLGIDCINMSDPSLITCFANDFGYENALVEFLKTSNISKKDMLILISSSAKSKNMINALKKFSKNFSTVVSLTGNKKNNTLGQKSSLNFHVNSKIYNVIENLHQILLLTVIDSIKLNKIK